MPASSDYLFNSLRSRGSVPATQNGYHDERRCAWMGGVGRTAGALVHVVLDVVLLGRELCDCSARVPLDGERVEEGVSAAATT